MRAQRWTLTPLYFRYSHTRTPIRPFADNPSQKLALTVVQKSLLILFYLKLSPTRSIAATNLLSSLRLLNRRLLPSYSSHSSEFFNSSTSRESSSLPYFAYLLTFSRVLPTCRRWTKMQNPVYTALPEVVVCLTAACSASACIS